MSFPKALLRLLPYTNMLQRNNVYGPHQYPEKIIPKFVNQLLRGRTLTLHGDGSNTRNYLHVEDCAAAPPFSWSA